VVGKWSPALPRVRVAPGVDRDRVAEVVLVAAERVA
jgi:hypothetical protein